MRGWRAAAIAKQKGSSTALRLSWCAVQSESHTNGVMFRSSLSACDCAAIPRLVNVDMRMAFS